MCHKLIKFFRWVELAFDDGVATTLRGGGGISFKDFEHCQSIEPNIEKKSFNILPCFLLQRISVFEAFSAYVSDTLSEYL